MTHYYKTVTGKDGLPAYRVILNLGSGCEFQLEGEFSTLADAQEAKRRYELEREKRNYRGEFERYESTRG
jgi:hypothetical protein